MGRKAIDPARRKKTLSITLSPEQIQMLQMLSDETKDNISVIVGRLVEREAARFERQKCKKQAKTDQKQAE